MHLHRYMILSIDIRTQEQRVLYSECIALTYTSSSITAVCVSNVMELRSREEFLKLSS